MAEELDNELENQDISTEEFDDDVESDPEEDRLYSMSDEELENFKKDKNYFVTVMGHVYKNDKDYCFKKVQCTIAQKRDNYKYTGQRIESELITEIDKRLAELKNTA